MKVTIGGVDQDIPPPNYLKLKRIWPMIALLSTSTDGMERMEAAVRIFAIVLMANDGDFGEAAIETAVADFERRLLAREIMPLGPAVREMLFESGLSEPTAGEPAPAVADVAAPPASPSMATSTD